MIEAKQIVVEVVEPVWVTGLIGLGGAILGALVGAYGAYKANIAAVDRAREARAAIRRKAKVYTPLRTELLDLQEWLETWPDAYDEIVTNPNAHAFGGQRNLFTIWEEMADDGRAFSVSSKVSETMRKVMEAIGAFNTVLDTVGEFIDRTFPPAIEEVSGDAPTPGSVQRVRSSLVLNREHWDIWWANDNHEQTRLWSQRVRHMVNGEPEIEELRQGAIGAMEHLKQSLKESIRTLDKAMQSIARKYEKEAPDD